MSKTAVLENLIKESGLKKRVIAERMSLSPYGLQRKIDGKSEFTVREMNEFCAIVDADETSKAAAFF